MPFGRTDGQWEDLIGAGLEILQETAAWQGRMTYTDFNDELAGKARQAKFNFNNPGDIKGISYLLADISKRGREIHKDFLITSIVVDKTNGQPGGGFYTLGEDTDLLKSGQDKLKFWVDQMNLTHDYYDPKRAAR
jgi:hypothetical protein